MKRKVLIVLLALITAIACAFGLVACTDDSGTGGDSGTDGGNTGTGGGETHKHDLQYVAAVDPTCTEGGSVEYWYCLDCGKYFDADGTELKDTSLPAAGHKWEEKEVIKEATCTEDGLRSLTCSACGEAKEETVAAYGHTLTAHSAVASDHINIGTMQYWTCDVCGKYYADLDAVTEIALTDTFTDPTGHKFGNWEIIKEATCTEEGERKRSCECGYTETETIHALGHDIQGVQCSRCSAMATDGLLFELNTYETGYICTGWNPVASGLAEDEQVDLIIPSEYENKPVVEIISGMEYPFAGNLHIRSVSLPDTIDTVGSSVFANCSNIRWVSIPNGVNRIESNAFSGCVGLASVTIPNSVSNVSVSAFDGCTGITSAVIPTWAFSSIPQEKLISIEFTAGETVYSLENCNSLKKLTVSDSVRRIENEAFSECSALELEEFGNAYYLGNADNRYAVLVKAVSKDVRFCTVHPETNVIAYSAFSDCTSLIGVRITGGKLKTIGSGAFSGCTALESVTIPESVSSVGDSAFYGCCSLKEAVFSERVTEIESNTFYNCTSLEKLCIPNVQRVGENAFTGCNSIKVLAMPMDVYSCFSYDQIVELEITSGTIPYGAFSYKAASLRKVTIGSGVKEIEGYPFDGCSIEILIIENGIESIGYASFRGGAFESVMIPASVKKINYGVFEHCNNLKEITVDPANKYYKDIDGVLFSKDCKTLVAYPSGKEGKSYEVPAGTETIATEAFFQSYLESIVVPDGVKLIENAFNYCSQLENITLPDSIQAIRSSAFTDTAYFENESNWENGALYIGNHLIRVQKTFSGNYSIKLGTITLADGAFIECSGLEGVEIPDTVCNIGEAAFSNCVALTEVNIPDSVCAIGSGAFEYCSLLERVTFGENVSSIGNFAFYNCVKLTNIAIPRSVTYLGEHAFADCNALTKIEYNAVSIEELNEYSVVFANAGTEGDGITVIFGESVTMIPAYLFYDTYTNPDSTRSMVTSIIFEGKVTHIGAHAFDGCSMVSEIELPDSLVSIGEYAFYQWNSLKSVVLPEGLTSVEEDAFGYCQGIIELVIPESVQGLDSMAFEGCIGIENVEIPIWALQYLYRYSLKTVALLDSGETSIPEEAFYYCTSLESVEIPESVTSIGEKAFYDCASLTSITIPKNMTHIGDNAFLGCYKLVEVYNQSSLNIVAAESWENGYIGYYAKNVYTQERGSWFTDTDSGYRFFYDGKEGYLMAYNGTETALTLPENFTAYDGTNVTDYKIYCYAFLNNQKLRSVVLSDSVTEIGENAFQNCASLKNLTIGSGVENIGSVVFNGCSALESISVSDQNEFYKSVDGDLYSKDGTMLLRYSVAKAVKEFTIPADVTVISDYAFEGCGSLESIVIPEGVTEIGVYAFSMCRALTEVVLPDSVKKIATSTFEYCYSLESITIGNGVEIIESYAFLSCSVLQTVYYRGTEEDWARIVIQNGNEYLISAARQYIGTEAVFSIKERV